MPNCPYCHRDSEAQVTLRKPRGVTRFTSTFTDHLRGRKRDRYDQTVAPAWPVREPQSPPRLVQLGAGETVYRTLSRAADIDPQWELSWRAALPVGALVVLGGAWYTWPALWLGWAPAAVVVAVAGGLFWRQNWDVLFPDEPVRLVAQERATENAPAPSAGKWKAESTVKVGKATTHDAPELADPWAWHRFCKAVVGGKLFSQSESKKHKVPPSDWTTVYNSWVSRRWLVPRGWRKAPAVLVVARRHIRNYATTPPPVER